MDAGYFWVGEIPGRSVSMRIMDDRGVTYDLTPYQSVEVEMLDTNNRKVDLQGSVTSVVDGVGGLIAFTFPKDRSVFKHAGEYLIRIKMSSPNALDYTEVNGIVVREFGGARW